MKTELASCQICKETFTLLRMYQSIRSCVCEHENSSRSAAKEGNSLSVDMITSEFSLTNLLKKVLLLFLYVLNTLMVLVCGTDGLVPIA